MAVACVDVAAPLTDDWVDSLAAAARDATLDPQLRLVVQQVIERDRADPLTYVIRLEDGRVTVQRGRAADADITFRQDEGTARAIAEGALSAQAAFMAGRLRVGGDLRAVLQRGADLSALEDVFATVRAAAAG